MATRNCHLKHLSGLLRQIDNDKHNDYGDDDDDGDDDAGIALQSVKIAVNNKLLIRTV